MINRKPYVPIGIRRRQAEARKGWTVIAGCALVFAGMVLGAAELDRIHAAPPAPSYSLVMVAQGDAYVMDHGLTATDCIEALQQPQARRWACEVER